MATWTDPSTVNTDPNDPVTSEFGTVALENPVAMAEGASGAVVVAAGWHPYDLENVGGSEDGEIYSKATDGALGTLTSPSFEDGYEYAFYVQNCEIGNVYLNSSVSAALVTNLGGTSGCYGMFAVCFPRLPAFNHSLLFLTAYANGSTVVKATGDNGSSTVRYSSAAVVNSVRFDTVNSAGAGKIFMFRRRDYTSG